MIWFSITEWNNDKPITHSVDNYPFPNNFTTYLIPKSNNNQYITEFLPKEWLPITKLNTDWLLITKSNTSYLLPRQLPIWLQNSY